MLSRNILKSCTRSLVPKYLFATGNFRKEYDTFGEILVPADKLWGA